MAYQLLTLFQAVFAFSTLDTQFREEIHCYGIEPKIKDHYRRVGRCFVAHHYRGNNIRNAKRHSGGHHRQSNDETGVKVDRHLIRRSPSHSVHESYQ